MFANNRAKVALSVSIFVCLVSAVFLTQPEQVDAGIIRTTITDNYYFCVQTDGVVCQDKNWVTSDHYEPWWHKFNPFHSPHDTVYVYRTQVTHDTVTSCSECDS